MKPLAAAESVVSEVLKTAERRNASSVGSVKVSIGELSGINTHQFASWFRTLSKGSAAENCRLTVDREPGLVKCICGFEGRPHQVFGEGENVVIECGDCKSTLVTPLSGKGYKIVELEMKS